MIEGVEGRPGTARTAGPSSRPTTSVASRCAVPPRKLDGASFGRRSAIHAAIAPAPSTNSSRKLSFPIPAWSMTPFAAEPKPPQGWFSPTERLAEEIALGRHHELARGALAERVDAGDHRCGHA